MRGIRGHPRNICRYELLLCAGLLLPTGPGGLAPRSAVAQSAPPQAGAGSPVGGWQSEVKEQTPAAKPRQRLVTGKPAPAASIRVTATELDEVDAETRFAVTISGRVGANVFTMAGPPRVVIDLPEVGFALPDESGQAGRGLVSSFRFGLIAAGRSRMILDLRQPARIVAADLAAIPGQLGSRLTLRLAATGEETFLREATPPRPAAAEPETAPAAATPNASGRKRPVVMIDPGHGGVDPGAIGTTSITEKAIVLSVAKHLAALLGAGKRYDVVLTRTGDMFVSLDTRLALSRRHSADLFISIHADAIDAKFAQSVRGASIYTLAENASDERARLLAEKENAADALAGVATLADADRDQVKGILIDLMQRETAAFSSEISGLLASRLPNALALSKDPQRRAAFKVLKQTQTPSVLIELGYMSNAEDEQKMREPEWQRMVAASIAAAVDGYFAKRIAGAP